MQYGDLVYTRNEAVKKKYIAMWDSPFENYLFLEYSCIHYAFTKY